MLYRVGFPINTNVCVNSNARRRVARNKNYADVEVEEAVEEEEEEGKSNENELLFKPLTSVCRVLSCFYS